MSAPKFYSDAEERLNIWTHAFGMGASVVGLFLLFLRASTQLSMVSALIFGLSLIILYAASTFYHRATDPQKRARLRVFDHAAIYVLIAGTYTPFSLITLPDKPGWLVFGIIWGLAIGGITLKLFFTGKFDLLSTIFYIGMGWVGIFFANSLIENLVSGGVSLILYGGISYTLGAILYSIKRLPYNHAIFHVFVLVGSFLHYLSIYLYVID